MGVSEGEDLEVVASESGGGHYMLLGMKESRWLLEDKARSEEGGLSGTGHRVLDVSGKSRD